MSGQTTTQAIERAEVTPRSIVQSYSDDFAAVLPSTLPMRAETFVRISQAALKQGKRTASGQTELEVAVNNNPGVFVRTLLRAAQLGLQPGTEEFYLTPRKVKGKLEILGIVGYQGLVELMYRAGFVSSVVAEVVREGDGFNYQPGRDLVPNHVIDWDAQRGDLRLVYAYAHMRGGGVSKVIVLNRHDIEGIKRSAQGAGSEYSPWQTSTEAMWLKSAARRLAKWVPTSAEYRMLDGVTMAEPGEVHAEPSTPVPPPNLDDEVADAEIVEEWPEGQEPFE